MTNTIKFSQFPNANLNDSSTNFVGLATGANIKSPKVVVWTTATRPSPPFNGVLGLNNDLSQYEFWDASSSTWIQLASSVDLTATFITKIPELTLPNSFALSTLSTGVLKSQTGTGNLSISAPLTSIDSLVTLADEILYTTGANTYAVTSLSPFSRGLLADTTALAWRTDLGVPGLPVTVSQGGTGDTSFTAFSVITGGTTSTGPLQNVSGVGVLGQVLTSNGAGLLPTWQNSASSGIVNPGLINQVAYYAANGSAVSGLATANNGVLVTDNSGVPSISSTLPLATQLNITELGTINTGTWNGSIIALAFGGTNANLTASAGGIVYSTASAFAISAVGTTGQLLQSNGGGAPTWTTATFPTSVGSAGTILRSNGTNWVASTSTFADSYSASNILYSNGANNVVGLATANNGVLITSAGGVPSIGSTLPFAVQLNITELGTIGTGTWNGTIIQVPFGGTGSGTFTAFSVICAGTTATGNFQNVSGVGAIGQVLTSQGPGALPQWANASGTGTVNSGLQNQLAYYAANGNTVSGLTSANNGLLVTSATGVPSILAGPGTTGNILQSNTASAPSFSTATYPSTTTVNQLLYSSSSNVVAGLASANSSVLVTSGGGTPSLSTTLPAGLTIPGYAASGANSDITSMSGLTGKLEAPTAIANTTGANVLAFTYVGSAVNYITVSSNVTGGAPFLLATGTDSAINLQFLSKNGDFLFSDNTNTIAPTLRLYNAAGTHFTGLKVATAQATDLTLTLPATDAAAANAPLVSNASGVLSFLTQAAITKIVIQKFTASGTYTVTSGLKYAIMEAVGGGGAGGGAAAAGSGAGTGGGGGGGGSYARIVSTAATIGGSQTVTIGAGGTAGTAGNNPGNNGGDTSVGTILIAKGGTGGTGSAGVPGGAGGAGGVAGTGDATIVGGNGRQGQYAGVTTVMPVGGAGGNSIFGFGASNLSNNGAATGNAGTGFGAGGGGGITYNNSGTVSGSSGTNGYVLITEFISV